MGGIICSYSSKFLRELPRSLIFSFLKLIHAYKAMCFPLGIAIANQWIRKTKQNSADVEPESSIWCETPWHKLCGLEESC